jgi:hypothetical protein
MKKFKDEWWFLLVEWLFLLVGIVLIAVVVISSMPYLGKILLKENIIYGKIISHHVTSIRNGTSKYNTIAIFEDGYVRELDGLTDYIKPIGSKVIHKEYVFK